MFSINHPLNLHNQERMSQGHLPLSHPPPSYSPDPECCDARLALQLDRRGGFPGSTEHRLKMPIVAAMLVVMQRFVDGLRRTQIAFFVSFFPGLNLRVGGFSL